MGVDRQSVSENAVDRGFLFRRESVGASATGDRITPLPVVGSAGELDRRQYHQHRPKQPHPTAGKEGRKADAEHGWENRGRQLTKDAWGRSADRLEIALIIQKAPQSSGQLNYVFDFTFPHHRHLPSGGFERRQMAGIPLNIACQFGKPIFQIRLRQT